MDIKESAELVEGRMTFMQEFLQKKYAWGIVFFVVAGLGVGASVYSYFKGVDVGNRQSADQIESLTNAKIDLKADLKTYKKDADDYKKLYDSCSRSVSSQDLNAMVRRKIEETDALRLLIEKSNSEKKVQNKIINNALKQ